MKDNFLQIKTKLNKDELSQLHVLIKNNLVNDLSIGYQYFSQPFLPLEEIFNEKNLKNLKIELEEGLKNRDTLKLLEENTSLHSLHLCFYILLKQENLTSIQKFLNNNKNLTSLKLEQYHNSESKDTHLYVLFNEMNDNYSITELTINLKASIYTKNGFLRKFKALKKLSFNTIVFNIDKLIATISKFLPLLTSIELNLDKLVKTDIDFSSTNIQNFSFRIFKIDDYSMKILLKNLKKMKTIQSLEIGLIDSDYRYVSLYSRDWVINFKELLIISSPNLVKLRINHMSLNKEEMIAVFQGIEKCDSLKELNFHNLLYFNLESDLGEILKSKKLTHLTFGDSGTIFQTRREFSVKKIMNHLQYSTDLTFLNLHECRFDDEDCILLSSLISKNLNLESLFIFNCLSEKEIENICKSIVTHQKLTFLSLGVENVEESFYELFVKNRTLKNVHIFFQKYKEDIIEEIFKRLDPNSIIKSIIFTDLSYTQMKFSSKSLDYLFYNTTLKEVSIGYIQSPYNFRNQGFITNSIRINSFKDINFRF